MLLSNLLDNLDGEKVHMKDMDILAVEFDSRKVRPGTLFIAVKGDKYDGHDFIKAAIEKGAVAIVTQHKLITDVPQYVVSDTRAIMGKIARKFYGDFSDMTKVAITGTNGKTTVSSKMIPKMVAEIGRWKNIIGLPFERSSERLSDSSVMELNTNPRTRGGASYLYFLIK